MTFSEDVKEGLCPSFFISPSLDKGGGRRGWVANKDLRGVR